MQKWSLKPPVPKINHTTFGDQPLLDTDQGLTAYLSWLNKRFWYELWYSAMMTINAALFSWSAIQIFEMWK